MVCVTEHFVLSKFFGESSLSSTRVEVFPRDRVPTPFLALTGTCNVYIRSPFSWCALPPCELPGMFGTGQATVHSPSLLFDAYLSRCCSRGSWRSGSWLCFL